MSRLLRRQPIVLAQPNHSCWNLYSQAIRSKVNSDFAAETHYRYSMSPILATAKKGIINGSTRPFIAKRTALTY